MKEVPAVEEHVPSSLETEAHKPPSLLVDRLDSSIGEMSTVMGGMMSELLRRALRGSIREIDEQLQGQAAHRIDLCVAERLPGIEQAAAEAADKVARQAATEVAVEEVRVLEQRTRESERVLGERIESTARASEQQTAESARVLSGKIELTAQKVELAVASTAHELNNRIEETARSAFTKTEEKAGELSRHIESVERRANEATTQQIDALLHRSKKSAAEIKDRLKALEETAAALHSQLEAHDQARRMAEEQLRDALRAARQENDLLALRVAELEKPTGLPALWAWLFGRRKKTVPQKPDPPTNVAADSMSEKE
jgi:hypothetical protein